MAKKIIEIITCDICEGNEAETFEKILVVCDGYMTERNTTDWSKDQPFSKRIAYKNFDLCKECQNRLIDETIHFLKSFDGKPQFYFGENKNVKRG